MLIVRAYRFRIYPTPDQAARLGRWEDALRFLWNLALEQRKMGLARPREERRFPTAVDQQRELTDLRAELPWLADVPRHVASAVLVSLEKASQRCILRLSRAPRWKRKDRDSLSFYESDPRVFRASAASVHFPKLGRLRAVTHCPLDGRPKTCRLKRDGDQWFAHIICESEVPDPPPRHDPTVAIDRGVISAVADSDGRLVESPRFYERARKRLARAQRAVSRKKKGSKNREKAKLRVMRIHRKVRRQREHFGHVLSAGYAKSHGTVVVEKLQIGNMVRTSRALARGIMDAGWGMFARFLRYKLEWTGGRLLEQTPAFSSQECSACGHVDAANRKGERFQCLSCGAIKHADTNASLVLLARANRSGLPVEASSRDGLRSRKRLRLPWQRRTQTPSAAGRLHCGEVDQ